VLCEKLFTLEAKNAEELIKIAEGHGRKLGVVHNQLYYPLIEALEPKINCMLIDRTYDEAYPSWVYTDGGGPLYETGYHAIYLLNHLMRPKPKLRCYRTNSQGHTLTFDSAQIRVFMGSKLEDRIRLFYDDGDLTVFPWFNSQTEDKLLRRAAMYWYCATNGREMPHTSTYREMLDEWVTFIRKGNGSPVPARLSPYLSLETVTVLESCEKWRDRIE
jgi:predicted dehydrogenase